MKTISQTQQDYIDCLKGKLSNYNLDMHDAVQRTSLTFESRGFREFNIDDLHDRVRFLTEKLENIRVRMRSTANHEERDRLEIEMGELNMRLRNISALIENGGRELLLGQYNPDIKTITLFVDNLDDVASSYGYNLENLTGYVFVHEMFHAYYDVNCQSIREIEEAMAEYGALSFLNSSNESATFNIAIKEIQEKQHSCTWTSAYGFGKYIFDYNSHTSLANDYRTAKKSVHRKKRLTSIFAGGFNTGYPFNAENQYLKLLYDIVYKNMKTVIPIGRSRANLAPLMHAICKVVSNHSHSIHSVNNIKNMFPKHLMSTRGTGQIIYDPRDIIKYRTCKASVNGIDYEIHMDSAGWRDHKPEIVDYINHNPFSIFTHNDQLELLNAIKKSGI